MINVGAPDIILNEVHPVQSIGVASVDAGRVSTPFK